MREDIKNMLDGIIGLHSKVEAASDDPDMQQIFKTLENVLVRIDEPDFPTSKDIAMLQAAVAVANDKKYL